ncbi:MAG: dihydrolipoamide acetyltransferase family protein [Solirubrobacterales bacterium]
MSSSLTETVEVTMPKMGVSISEGTVVEWLAGEGEAVDADQAICEVTTDKIDVEIPAPAAGILRRILVSPGETVTVGTTLAEIGGDEPAQGPGEDPDPEAAGVASNGGRASKEGTDEIDRSSFYSPVVRRIAASERVELSKVTGHGVGGRVRKQDLLAYIQSKGGAEGDEHSAPTLHSDSPYVPEAPTGNGSGAAAAPVAPVADGSGDGEPGDEGSSGERRVPMEPMRRAIARHMVESRRTSAHCTTVVEADFSAVDASRAELRESMAERGVALTYLAYVAKATVEALGNHPVLNSSIEGEEIIHHADVNLGIAVALEDGLVVPVIRQAQRLSLEGLAAAIGDLAVRARNGSLGVDDVGGGTFTITNPGQFGALLATPIINQPEVAILDLEAIVRRPVVVDGPGGEAIGIRPMSYLCMSWDHRALDGVGAARFLGDVRSRLEGGDLR